MRTIIPPGNDKAATLERRNIRIILGTGCIFINPELGTNRNAVIVIDLRPHIPAGTAAVTGVVMPGDHVTTTLKTRHSCFTLLAAFVAVHPELTANGVTICIKLLRPDIPVVTVTGVVTPCDHKATIRKRTNGRHFLRTGCVRVHHHLVTNGNRRNLTVLINTGGITLHPDIPARATIMTGAVMPRHHEVTAGEGRDMWFILGILYVAVNQYFLANGIAVNIVTLHPDIPARATIMTGTVHPRHHKATVIKAGNAGLTLLITRMRIDPELVANGRCFRIKTLSTNVPTTTTISARVIAPRNNKPAIGKGLNVRIFLSAADNRVHQELTSNRLTNRVVQLTANVRTRTTGMTGTILPRHNKAAVREGRYRWIVLV